jgi:hypothetical protein
MIYLTWALLLVFQNAAFTWVSRARNSGSDWYHALAAVFSNGIWFAATFITFERVWTVLKTGNVELGILIGAVYVVATVTGSVSMGMFLRRFVETGKRKVGHYEEQASQLVELGNRIRGLESEVGGLLATKHATPNPDVPMFSPGMNMLHPAVRESLREYVRGRDVRARRYGRG